VHCLVKPYSHETRVALVDYWQYYICICVPYLCPHLSSSHTSYSQTHTQWCGPCRTVGPIVEELSKTYPAVAFGKVDVDENSDSAVDFEIKSVPTFVVFEGETAIHKFSGADPVQLEKHVKLLSGK
jgi:thioredoxin 1